MMEDYERALLRSLSSLYRSRPFTKSVPFNITLPSSGETNQLSSVWVPVNAYFELAVLVIRSDTAGIDLAVCDANASNPFLFVMPPTTEYQVVDISPGYRSLQYQNTRLGFNDPTLSGAIVKGVALGWEVNPDGGYR